MLYLLQVTGRHLWFHKHPNRLCTLFSTIMSCCLTPENLCIVVGILLFSCIEADIYVVISQNVLDFCCHLWCFKHPNVRHIFPEFRHVAWHRKHGHSRWNFVAILGASWDMCCHFCELPSWMTSGYIWQCYRCHHCTDSTLTMQWSLEFRHSSKSENWDKLIHPHPFPRLRFSVNITLLYES